MANRPTPTQPDRAWHAPGFAWRAGAAGLAVAIPSIAVFGNPLLGLLRAGLGDTGVTLLLALLLGGLAGWAGYRTHRAGTRAQWGWLAAAFAVATLVLYCVPIGPRWTHVVLFAPLGLAAGHGFGGATAVAVVVAIGAGDEALQYVLAGRTGSVLDVAANLASAAAGLALARATAQPTAPTPADAPSPDPGHGRPAAPDPVDRSQPSRRRTHG